ncbi:MAG: hypothetical protein LQ338_002303 [Usnochroma carphineum]|nr:MAG: hypothetical protein LQ338_002303 [Usnochroma carphineum]
MQRPSRLRPAVIDPLDSVGLVSKGDRSLLDHSTQESYFNTIKTRYHALAGTSKARKEDGDALATNLATLSLDQHVAGDSKDATKKESLAAAHAVTASPELSTIIMAMRKLREAVVASGRNDAFAKTVYLFIIRTTIMLGHPESYHPALLHLFHRLHVVRPLSKEEEKEFVGYFLLDMACRQHDLANALWIQNMYDYRIEKINMVLSALVHGDWVLFGKAKRTADIYQKHLMTWADERMASHSVQCLGRSYLSLPRDSVERCTGMRWEKLKELKKLSWTLDGDTVVIKQVKRR